MAEAWEELTAQAVPIKARAKVRTGPRAKGMEEKALSDRIPRPSGVKAAPAKKIKKGTEISGAQLRALERGEVRIDARLDLHGMTQREAHAELDRFLAKQVARGARLLLIITGKGKTGEGVLRRALPGWMMAGPFKPHILTLHPAHARHGGDGATYVLMRRRDPRR